MSFSVRQFLPEMINTTFAVVIHCIRAMAKEEEGEKLNSFTTKKDKHFKNGNLRRFMAIYCATRGFQAGPEGPLQPSAGERRRVAVGHPNLLIRQKLKVLIWKLSYDSTVYYRVRLPEFLYIFAEGLWVPHCLCLIPFAEITVAQLVLTFKIREGSGGLQPPSFLLLWRAGGPFRPYLRAIVP